MFEFLKRWFHTSAAAPEPAAQADARFAPGTAIHYDPHLVSQLVAEHRQLETMFGRIVAASQVRDEHSLATHLSAFGDAMREHLLKENVRFYVYLLHICDTEQAHIVHDFQHEMRGIGKALSSFLFRHYEREDWSEPVWAEFDRELDGIGQVLTRRIATEESTLYPLYQPPR